MKDETLAELRRKVQVAREQFKQYGGHGAEVEVAQAELRLAEYLEMRDEALGDGVRRGMGTE